MFKSLQKKWKVNALQFWLIILTFAVGGSLTGYVGRKLMSLFGIDQKGLWLVIYIIMIVLLWPLAVVLVSLLTGQFRFFVKYIERMGIRLKIVGSQGGVRSSEWGVRSQDSRLTAHASRSPIQLAIFASGTGTNTQKIIDYFKNSSAIKVALVVCNNPQAGVLKIAAKENIDTIVIDKEKFFRGNHYIDELKQKQIDLIVLAGFLWKLPSALTHAFQNRIVNIHPALLPKFGGKGMYGEKVHTAVLTAGEKESGITIHYVDEFYDNGDIILQVKCPVLTDDTPDTLAQRIHRLEHEYYPKVIDEIARKVNIGDY